MLLAVEIGPLASRESSDDWVGRPRPVAPDVSRLRVGMIQGLNPRLHVGGLQPLIVVLVQVEVPAKLPRRLELDAPLGVRGIHPVDRESPLLRVDQVQPLDRGARSTDWRSGRGYRRTPRPRPPSRTTAGSARRRARPGRRRPTASRFPGPRPVRPGIPSPMRGSSPPRCPAARNASHPLANASPPSNPPPP